MGENKISSLSLIAIENEKLQKINTEITDTLPNQKFRKINLML